MTTLPNAFITSSQARWMSAALLTSASTPMKRVSGRLPNGRDPFLERLPSARDHGDIGAHYKSQPPRPLVCSAEVWALLGLIFRRSNNVVDVGTPTIQCFLALGQKFMALIDGRHTGDRARLVVEDILSAT